MSRKIEIAAFVLSAVLQAVSFAYFLGGVSARIKAVEDRLGLIEQHIIYEVKR